MGKNEDFTDYKGGKMENFADTSAFNAGVKEKTYKDFPFYGICLNMIL